MKTIIYIHGYGSTPNSDKARGLRKHFQVIAPKVPIKFFEACKVLIKCIDEHPNSILVGTSLGGYWASLMSEAFLIPAVLINPSCSPAETLVRYNNLELTEAEIEKYISLDPQSGIPRIVMLAKNDEVLDYKVAEKLFTKKAKIKLYETGEHRFNDVNRITESVFELENGSFYLP